MKLVKSLQNEGLSDSRGEGIKSSYLLALFIFYYSVSLRLVFIIPTKHLTMLFLATFFSFSFFTADSLKPVVNTPVVQARVEAVRRQMSSTLPILSLDTAVLTPQQAQAQRVVLADTELRTLFLDADTKRPLRSEIFGIMPARPSDYSAAPECSDGSCYRVELYNYANNGSILAIVHLAQNKVIRFAAVPQTQPDIPTHLKELALHIAIEAPEVEKALGFKPTRENALMADTKTALNRTRCERSRHLCVAPTFVKDNRALWVIVDLTDLSIAGLRWTNTGNTITRPTERRIQNDELTECYCVKTNALERDGWKFNYIITSSDGLRISEVDFNGKRVVRNAKLVDWHVSYSNTDGFGYSDAVGCPFFSSAAVIAIEKPRIEDITENGAVVGFSLSQNYASEGWPTPCNYNYEQRYEFYKDGRFRVAAASLGRGCGNNGTYRPVSRVVFENARQFAEWTGADWKTWTKEGWQLQKNTTRYTPEGYQYQLTDGQGSGFAVLANTGQMNDGGRGDEAYTYITKNHPDLDEGESDLITIGPCCNTDYRQGPEKFIEPKPEPINNDSELVFWYVPQIRNDDRDGKKYCWAESVLKDGVYETKVYPCYSGPMFVPVK